MIENHVVSLEIAKKLKEAGWNKETKFWWIHNKVKDVYEIKYGLSQCVKDHPESWEYFPASIATEILEELPDEIEKNDETYQFYLYKDSRGFITGYRLSDAYNPPVLDREMPFIDKILSNALTKMWLYLKENKLLGGKE